MTAAPTPARWRPVVLLAGTLATLALTVWNLIDAATGYLMDLSVFRDAGYAVTARLPLYSEDFPTSSGFRFIYPPFAAALFAPMATVDPTVLQVLWSAANLVLLWWCARLVLTRLTVSRPALTAAALTAPALLLEPVRSNFAFGQINLVLMALVLADLLDTLPRRWRGVGIGIAAAIKLTPAAFGLVLLLRRDAPSIARAAGAFLAPPPVSASASPRKTRCTSGPRSSSTPNAPADTDSRATRRSPGCWPASAPTGWSKTRCGWARPW